VLLAKTLRSSTFRLALIARLLGIQIEVV